MKKYSELSKMNVEDREKKLKELKMELIKFRVGASKGGSGRIREAKKTIARLKTINKSSREESNKK